MAVLRGYGVALIPELSQVRYRSCVVSLDDWYSHYLVTVQQPGPALVPGMAACLPMAVRWSGQHSVRVMPHAHSVML